MIYHKIIEFLANQAATYQTNTLGGQKQVSFSLPAEGGGISITNASSNSHTFSPAECQLIIDRYNELPDEQKLSTSQYSHPAWPESPNLIFAPYFPALIRDVIENDM